jgi:hypothetical protein
MIASIDCMVFGASFGVEDETPINVSSALPLFLPAFVSTIVLR